MKVCGHAMAEHDGAWLVMLLCEKDEVLVLFYVFGS